jgi:hypothetical protein
MLKLLLQSMTVFGKYSGDLLLITDEQMKAVLQDVQGVLQGFTVHYLLQPPCEGRFMSSARKLNVFDFPGLRRFSPVLYLDLDVLVVRPLASVFAALDHAELLYAGVEPETFCSNYKAGALLNIPEGGRNITADGIPIDRYNVSCSSPGFSAGLFMFAPHDRIRSLFNRTMERIMTWIRSGTVTPSCLEQPFMNFFFVLEHSLHVPGISKFVMDYMPQGSGRRNSGARYRAQAERKMQILRSHKKVLIHFATGNSKGVSGPKVDKRVSMQHVFAQLKT